MLTFIARRAMLAAVTIWALSVLSFLIIQLPPGDFVDTYVQELFAGSWATGGATQASDALEETLRTQFGLDKPFIVQYGKWAWKMVQGDFGLKKERRKKKGM